LARRVRIALFSAEKPISNQYLVRAQWSPQEEDRWKFSFPLSSMNQLIVKSNFKQTFLLIELSVLVQDEFNKQSEMTCGFATLELAGDMLSKTVIVRSRIFRQNSRLSLYRKRFPYQVELLKRKRPLTKKRF
jgi:hypothetical protein